MGKLHTLGEARCSRGILHIYDVIDVKFGLTGKIVLLRSLASKRLYLIERIHSAMLFAAEEEDALQMRIFLRLKFAARTLLEFRNKRIDHFNVIAIAEAVNHEKVLRLRLRKRKIHFVRLVVGIERQQNRTDFRRREHEYYPVRHIGRPERNLLPALDAQRHKPLGDQIDLLGELEPRKAIVAIGIDDSVILAATRNCLIKKLAQSIFTGNRQVMPRSSSRN